jgi:iron complex transport system substrate-binding protein
VRIVSLLPSATEIVCALGLRDQLVGVSHECDFPQSVVGLPKLTAAKIDAERPSAEIDRDIRKLVESGLGVYRMNAELLAELKPDLIVTQDQCEVCAVSFSDVLRATRELVGLDVRIVSLRPSRLEDVWIDIETVAEAAGCAARGAELTRALRNRLAALERRTRRLARPRIACLEWLDPLMAAGNWVPDLVELAGGAYDLVDSGAHSAWLDWQRLAASSPDVLCAMPCGFGLDRTRTEITALLREPRWATLPAVSSGRIFAVDASAYFNRPGPRLVESAEILAAILHPEECGDLLPNGAAVRVPAQDGAIARDVGQAS